MKGIVILVIVLILLAVIGSILSGISENRCKKKCEDMGAIHYDCVHDSTYFSLKDKCVCFFKDEIKSFRLGE